MMLCGMACVCVCVGGGVICFSVAKNFRVAENSRLHSTHELFLMLSYGYLHRRFSVCCIALLVTRLFFYNTVDKHLHLDALGRCSYT